MPTVKTAPWQPKLQPKHNDVHRGCLLCWLLRCYINIQIVADKLLCLFPLLQIPEHAQKVVLQANIGERKSRMEGREKCQKQQ